MKKENNMRQEFEMTQEEMNNIIAINKDGGDPVMFGSGGVPHGSSLREKVNAYWEILGSKYGFKPMTVEGSSKGKLFFIAEPTPPPPPVKTQTEIEIEKYTRNAHDSIQTYAKISLRSIAEQLESCNYTCEGGELNNNVAFLALKELSN